MKSEEQSLSYFTADLASASPAPGGGGASALAGALGAALASMVANLTVGKKKYAQFEDDLSRILDEAAALRVELLACIDEDAVGFEPLARAYGIPKDDPAREKIMEDALRTACVAPLKMMKLISKSIDLHEELTEKGSALMISDVGVGVLCCKAALLGASLNIRINAKMMRDKAYAGNLIAEVEAIISVHPAKADDIYAEVVKRIID